MEIIEGNREIVGREAELGVLREFVENAPSGGGLVLVGGPGIGKTTLWQAGLELARAQGVRVLRARPSDAEARLSFAALTDLLDGVETTVGTGIPAPQRRALEVALLRSEAGARPPSGERAIALGLLNVLRGLAEHEPLLVAIDDIQWLDAASADALSFVARRLEGVPVRFLLARRSGSASSVERELGPAVLQQVELSGLSFGAMRRVLFEQLGFTTSHRMLRRIFAATDGNPFFALELGRALEEQGPLEIGAEIALTVGLDELLGARVEQLTTPVRGVLLASALAGPATIRDLGSLADRTELDDAVDAGLLVIEGELVRVSHPLLAAAARARSSTEERRRIHAELARSTTNSEAEARHLALAADRPDAALASLLAAAAAAANARGAVEDAVELAEHAVRLSPSGEGRPERVLSLADYLYRAGELQGMNTLLAAELEALPSGGVRARAHLLLCIAPPILAESAVHLNQALTDSANDPLVRAEVLAYKSEELSTLWLEKLQLAERWALEALRLAGPEAGADIVAALGWVRIMRGRPIDDLIGRSSATVAPESVQNSIDRLMGIRLAFRGHVSAAREMFLSLVAVAEDRGESWSVDGILHQLCELELRAGDWNAAASRLAQQAPSFSEVAIAVGTHDPRIRAVIAAIRGLPVEAERFAAATIAGIDASGMQWDRLEALRARGIAALCAGDPARAAESLRTVWAHTSREGIDDPGAFPVAPELVEALVELEEKEEARAVTERLKDLAEEQEHPWGLATVKRCLGLAQLATRVEIEAGAAALLEATAEYEALGLRFDAARSLLALGRGQRRMRKWGAARVSLERARTAFDEFAADGWAEQARFELARVGGRRPQVDGELTPSEQRTAELAAGGLSNKQIAAALFVSVHTVEVHLSRVYAKLGVHSRAQLAQHLPITRPAPVKD